MFSYLNGRKGSALVVVLIVMAVMSVLGTTVLRIAVAENNFTARQENKMQAYYIARSGAQAIAEYMIKDANNNAHDFINQGESVLNTQIGGGGFKVTVSDDIINNVVNIVSVGEYNGIEQQIKIRVTRSVSGLGGIFQHAIAAKKSITVDNEAGTNIVITGSIAVAVAPTEIDVINLGTHGVVTNGKIYDPNLIFPTIVEPIKRIPKIDYDETHGEIDLKNDSLTIPSSDVKPTYVYADSITIKNGEILVTGNGVVHMYVNGDINLDTGSKFNIAKDAKLYIYVIGKRTITFTGDGAQNNVFLYAPDSNITWNNAGSGDFFGAIIGDTVLLHNKTKIKHNPDMVNEVDLDTTGAGATFTGYTWVD